VQGPNLKGAVAEQAIVLAAMKLGVPVLAPVAEHGRADLALDVGGRLWRVQCKWGSLNPTGDVIIVRIGGSRLSTNRYICTTYTEDEVDLFAVYCGQLNRSFLLPVSLLAGKHQIHLRLRPPRNCQRACITLADDFDFDGAIAQLGERSAGSRKVAGSNPASSTPRSRPTVVASNPFRDRLGYWMERVAGGEEVLVTYRGKPRILVSPANAALRDAVTDPDSPTADQRAPPTGR
jgi:antitoxin (DNA-binding transcriptional repressor) of toxin-antitoxin stability system